MAKATATTATLTEQRVYKAARLITDDEAAIIGPILDQMADEGRGRPQDILEAAAPEQSPLHRFFEWSDDKAAYEYRLNQARQLARSYNVEIVEVNDGRRTVFLAPGLVHIRTTEGPTYMTIGRVRADPDKLDQAMCDAEGRLRYWRSKFAMYRGLEQFRKFEPVFAALDALEDTAPPA